MQFDGSSVLEEPPLKPAHSHISRDADWTRAGPKRCVRQQLVRSSTPASPVTSPSSLHPSSTPCGSLVSNKYLIQEATDGNSLHTCTHVHTKQQYVCKIMSREASGSLLAAHYRLDSHPHINSLHEVLLGDKTAYLVFPPCSGDLHSYVRQRKRLKEGEARRLFRQIADTVRACHAQGIVLRDLKLRKFVFCNAQRDSIKLETLEDAVVLEDSDNDELQDKRGCPAYVSPEILRSHARYSGRAADMWSLGVILYTMLVGRYPFNDSEHASLFLKISRGQFVTPDSLSPKAKCLIRSLLRRDPGERLSSEDTLHHPWLREGRDSSPDERDLFAPPDQTVPDIDFDM